MQNLVQQQTNSLKTVLIFGAYCFGGVTALSYVSYRTFRSVSHRIKIDRPAGQRLQLSKMGSVPGLAKAVAAIGIYFAGFGLLAWKLNVSDRVFQSCIQKDKDYTNKIKLDPFYQNFYIINTMSFFGISQRLIKKTEQQLRQKIEQNKDKQKIKQDLLVSFEKNVMKIAQAVGQTAKNSQ